MSNGYFRPPVGIFMPGLNKKLAILGSDGMGMNVNTFQCCEVGGRHAG